MKKILSLLGTISMMTSAITPVISCANISNYESIIDDGTIDHEIVENYKELKSIAELPINNEIDLNYLHTILDKSVLMLDETYNEIIFNNYTNELSMTLNKYQSILDKNSIVTFDDTNTYRKKIQDIQLEYNIRFSNSEVRQLLNEYEKVKNSEYYNYLSKFQNSIYHINDKLSNKYYQKNEITIQLNDIREKIKASSDNKTTLEQLQDINSKTVKVIEDLSGILGSIFNTYEYFRNDTLWYAEKPGMAFIPFYGHYFFKQFSSSFNNLNVSVKDIKKIFDSKNDPNSIFANAQLASEDVRKLISDIDLENIDLPAIGDMISTIDGIALGISGATMLLLMAFSASGPVGAAIGLLVSLLTMWVGDIIQTYKLSKQFYDFDNDTRKGLLDLKNKSKIPFDELLTKLNTSGYSIANQLIKEKDKFSKLLLQQTNLENQINKINNEINLLEKQKNDINSLLEKQLNNLLGNGYKYMDLSNRIISYKNLEINYEEVKKDILNKLKLAINNVSGNIESNKMFYNKIISTNDKINYILYGG